MSYRSWILSSVFGFLAFSGCEAEEASGPSETVADSRGVLQGPGGPERSAGPLHLGPRSSWVRLNPVGPALYSPQVSSDGRWVGAAGRGGVGLFLMEVSGRDPVRVVALNRRGPWAWATGPVALHFEEAPGIPRVFHPGRRTRSTQGALRPWARPMVEEHGELLSDGPAGRWYHHPRRGTVTYAPAGQRPRLVADEDAWGAAVSLEGRFAAYSRGLLADSRFFVHDAERGLTRELGPGVHPVWLPGRGVVIYAVPAGVGRHAGGANVTGSELWLYDFRTGEHRALTATSGLAEMEPALCPGGESIVWADWLGGGIWRAALLGGGAP